MIQPLLPGLPFFDWREAALISRLSLSNVAKTSASASAALRMVPDISFANWEKILAWDIFWKAYGFTLALAIASTIITRGCDDKHVDSGVGRILAFS